ncbi:MAG TPA: hypothetical protein VM621_10125 [Luteibacter sp.]|uniref:hypothetical protein n=1 Tax=Luteibacter sp. TaxID=1886636 RepID=UPI002C5A0784|nr:hypothetical protein [Luteibacter sp.]HVI55397.1 hypothetical protein [Luteibacter sp.]
MKVLIQLSIAIAMLVGCVNVMADAHSRTLSSDVFALGRIKIGVTTIAEAQEILGKTVSFRSRKVDESPVQICYLAESPNVRFYVLFEAGSMGGFSRITRFSISRQAPSQSCGSLRSPAEVMSSGNGVKIGQSYQEFLSKFSVRFTSVGDKLIYRAQTSRSPNAEELIVLKKAWPEEKAYRLEVLVNINADFENGFLSKYEVSRIESY